MRTKPLMFVCLTTVPAVFAQQGLNNDAVIKLVKAGLSDMVVVSTVQGSPGQYDTSVDGLLALKGAGVHDTIIAAIFARGSGGATPANTIGAVGATKPAANPDDPTYQHEAGIWIYSEKASGPKMTELEPSVYSQGKMGGVFGSAMTYGIVKAKTKAVIRSAHSNARISDAGANFYFYFEQQSAGLSNASSRFGGTSTPNEYTLLRFEVKGDTRETTVGKFNAYGSSSGTDEKAIVSFTYEKIRPGVYKVTPKAPLTQGEYGFVTAGGSAIAGPYGAAAASSSSRVFDFGVNGSD